MINRLKNTFEEIRGVEIPQLDIFNEFNCFNSLASRYDFGYWEFNYLRGGHSIPFVTNATTKRYYHSSSMPHINFYITKNSMRWMGLFIGRELQILVPSNHRKEKNLINGRIKIVDAFDEPHIFLLKMYEWEPTNLIKSCKFVDFANIPKKLLPERQHTIQSLLDEEIKRCQNLLELQHGDKLKYSHIYSFRKDYKNHERVKLKFGEFDNQAFNSLEVNLTTGKVSDEYSSTTGVWRFLN